MARFRCRAIGLPETKESGIHIVVATSQFQVWTRFYSTFQGLLFAVNPRGDDWGRLDRLWALIQKYEAQQRILIVSESQRTLNRFRHLARNVVATALAPKEPERLWRTLGRRFSWWFRPSYNAVWLDTQPDELISLSADRIAWAHRRRLELFVGTGEDPNMIRQLVMLAVDGIVTKRPDLLAEAFQQQSDDLDALIERARELYAFGLVDEALLLAGILTRRQDATAFVCGCCVRNLLKKGASM